MSVHYIFLYHLLLYSFTDETAEFTSSDETDISVGAVAGKSTCDVMFSENLAPSKQIKRKRGKRQIMTPKLASALDKRKLSDREAIHILVAVSEVLRHDTHDFVINRSSIHIYWKKAREERATEIQGHKNASCCSALGWQITSSVNRQRKCT